MKLLAKTNLYFVVLSIPVLLLSGFVTYSYIIKELKESNDDVLMDRKERIEQYLRENDTISDYLFTKGKEVQIKIITKPDFKKVNKDIFSDTLIFDRSEKELAINQMITSVLRVKTKYYQIKIWRSSVEFDELFEGIFSMLTAILLLQLLISLGINFWVTKTLWQPFYKMIHTLRVFRASDNHVPNLEKTSVKEFKELSHCVKEMMSKMITDYNSQKRFTENASHEIQTPLAVIKSKIDLLIQSENLEQKDIELIIAIDDASSKLIRLNKSLLLLTKIENRQFKTTETVSVEKMVNESLLLFEEHIREQKIEVQKNVKFDFLIKMNSDLCMILINNLFQNAIRHNITGGKIIIFINHNKLSIQNTGKEEALDATLLFKRFQKISVSHLSVGLGMAIADEIAEVSGLKLKYKFVDHQHRFTLKVR
ncbi:HAMP domain-containing histidine kinase [Flavobacterium sp. AC]|uniref:histidine kinase n=1 Tax=Flavobacterium azizsancarii TaxID=2961580 RepID=A0ABT4WE11_9FLAO|nr:HAMP domain-containing sensor histidine kinase [Flavobacterium azizsancarii]MDA6070834.1 HAMP domain-containing histidine kinase [Flavobacterium azizsancarii]